MKRDEVRRLRAHVRNMSARAASELPPGPLGVPAWSRLTPRQAIRGDAGGEKHGRCRQDVRDWRAEKRPPHLATDAEP
jgi:hypothetical protein